MSKTKLTLDELQVQSFVTTLNADAMHNVKGGLRIRGRRYTYRGRWTAVDTRADYDPTPSPLPPTGGIGGAD